MRTLAVTALVLGLFAGTAAAFVVTVRLKLERSPLRAVRVPPRFSPVCDCPREGARIRFGLRRADRIDVAIVDSAERRVKTLLRERRPRGRVRLVWDGTDERGEVVPEGAYRLRVAFRGEAQTILVPDRIVVDTTAPVVVLGEVSPTRFSPDGDGRRDEVEVPWTADAEGIPELLVEGEVAARGRRRVDAGSFAWDGTVGSRPLPPGLYALAVQVRDEVGNVSPPTESVGVRLRFVDIALSRLVVREGRRLRVRVSADARSYRWELRRKGARSPLRTGRARPGTLSIRLGGRVSPGRYVLRVTAAGRSDRALVVVRRR